jgi:hypothetical protein
MLRIVAATCVCLFVAGCARPASEFGPGDAAGAGEYCIGAPEFNRLTVLDWTGTVVAVRPLNVTVPYQLFRFSGDGSAIAGNTSEDMVVTYRRSGDLKRFSSRAMSTDYRLSRTGQQLAWVAKGPQGERGGLHILDVAMGTDRLVAESGRSPSWSATEGQLLFEDRGEIVQLDIVSNHRRVVTAGRVASWAPDGTATVVIDKDGSAWLLSGSGPKTRLFDAVGMIDRPEWSPDGRYLLWAKRGSGGVLGLNLGCLGQDTHRLMLTEVSTGRVRTVDESCWPFPEFYGWVPDRDLCRTK